MEIVETKTHAQIMIDSLGNQTTHINDQLIEMMTQENIASADFALIH
jgi:hypothetical protein